MAVDILHWCLVAVLLPLVQARTGPHLLTQRRDTVVNRILEWLAGFQRRRQALTLAMQRFEAVHNSPADRELSFVYVRAGDVYFVKVRGLWTSQWYAVKADGTAVDEVIPPATIEDDQAGNNSGQRAE